MTLMSKNQLQLYFNIIYIFINFKKNQRKAKNRFKMNYLFMNKNKIKFIKNRFLKNKTYFFL